MCSISNSREIILIVIIHSKFHKNPFISFWITWLQTNGHTTSFAEVIMWSVIVCWIWKCLQVWMALERTSILYGNFLVWNTYSTKKVTKSMLRFLSSYISHAKYNGLVWHHPATLPHPPQSLNVTINYQLFNIISPFSLRFSINKKK